MNETYTIFLFENERKDSARIIECLEGEPVKADDPEFKVTLYERARDASQAIEQASDSGAPHLALLDRHQPNYIDAGWDICRKLRARWPKLPVVFLSGHDTFEDQRAAYSAGGINFLSKEILDEEIFEEYLREVISQILGIIREPHPDQMRYQTGSLTIDLERSEASWRGELLNLRGNDFLILAALAKPKDATRIVTYKCLNRATGEAFSRTHVAINIRKRIQFIRDEFAKIDDEFGEAWKSRKYGILTEANRGYSWKPDQVPGSAASPSTQGN